MCAQYTVEPGPKELEKAFQAEFQEGKAFTGHTRILPHQSAPILTKLEKNRILQLMKFSLLPAWSKEPKVKFATHNARLSTFDDKLQKDIFIFEKPTWRDAFQKRPCLVPISDFFESAYRGPLAGNMVRFAPKKESILMAAGIWENWTSKTTGEVIVSFTILTDEPSDFIRENGHNRLPLFLSESAWDAWLSSTPKQQPKEKVTFLRENRAEIDFKATSDRPLKSGWEKRIPKE